MFIHIPTDHLIYPSPHLLHISQDDVISVCSQFASYEFTRSDAVDMGYKCLYLALVVYKQFNLNN